MTASPQANSTTVTYALDAHDERYDAPGQSRRCTVRIDRDGVTAFDGVPLGALARFQPALRSADTAILALPAADVARFRNGEARTVTVSPGVEGDPSRVRVVWREFAGRGEQR